VKADTKTEVSVMEIINQFVDSFSKRDLDGVLALIAQDLDVVLIGSGADEKCIGWDEIKAVFKRDFSQSEEISLQLGWHSVSSAGSVAWVAADGFVRARVRGQETSFPVRLTFVLEQREGKWLIMQTHGSLPAAGQKEGEGWPTRSE